MDFSPNSSDEQQEEEQKQEVRQLSSNIKKDVKKFKQPTLQQVLSKAKAREDDEEVNSQHKLSTFWSDMDDGQDEISFEIIPTPQKNILSNKQVEQTSIAKTTNSSLSTTDTSGNSSESPSTSKKMILDDGEGGTKETIKKKNKNKKNSKNRNKKRKETKLRSRLGRSDSNSDHKDISQNVTGTEPKAEDVQESCTQYQINEDDNIQSLLNLCENEVVEDDNEDEDDYAYVTVASLGGNGFFGAYRKYYDLIENKRARCRICSKTTISNHMPRHIKSKHGHQVVKRLIDKRTTNAEMDSKCIIHNGKWTCIEQGCLSESKSHDLEEIIALQSFRKHWRMIHGNHYDKPHMCTFVSDEGVECGRRFIDPSHLALHERSHCMGEQLVCDSTGCEYKTYDAYYMRQHKRCHGDEAGFRFPCRSNGCTRKFPHAMERTIHEQDHETGELFKCPVPTCRNQKFKSIDSFERHLIKHDKDRRQCSSCPKSFLSTRILMVHLQVCLGLRKMRCEACKVGFPTRDEYFVHTKTKSHLEKLEATRNILKDYQLESFFTRDADEWNDELVLIPSDAGDSHFKCDCKPGLKCYHQGFKDVKQIKFQDVTINVTGLTTCWTQAGVYIWIIKNKTTGAVGVYVGQFTSTLRGRSKAHFSGNDCEFLRDVFFNEDKENYEKYIIPLYCEAEEDVRKDIVDFVEALVIILLNATNPQYGYNSCDGNLTQTIHLYIQALRQARIQRVIDVNNPQ